jgi:hypothetical protein
MPASGHRRPLLCPSRLLRAAQNHSQASDKCGGAILGFANILLGLYKAERPHAVLVDRGMLNEPAYRHKALVSIAHCRFLCAVASNPARSALLTPGKRAARET